jgi:hypothetical protein
MVSIIIPVKNGVEFLHLFSFKTPIIYRQFYK